MNRRQFLGGSAIAAAAGLAGCTEFVPERREGVVLTHIELGNASTEPQRFDVIVSYDDEFVQWDSYEVEARVDEQTLGGRVIEVDAPDDPGRVEVSVRVGETWKRADFDTGRYDGEQVIAIATYGLPEAGILRLSRVISDRSTATDG